ncbi:hypothetical protein ACMD2_13568 [Ananas comosus]|uniref:Uncharacterized protein n=1 Tax=Ananas comosus TaxID=4615 RepID=A0A199URA6_ANACO|nr:hypothetical protein ACMD2_13568 [Ananas comosus]
MGTAAGRRGWSAAKLGRTNLGWPQLCSHYAAELRATAAGEDGRRVSEGGGNGGLKRRRREGRELQLSQHVLALDGSKAAAVWLPRSGAAVVDEEGWLGSQGCAGEGPEGKVAPCTNFGQECIEGGGGGEEDKGENLIYHETRVNSNGWGIRAHDLKREPEEQLFQDRVRIHSRRTPFRISHSPTGLIGDGVDLEGARIRHATGLIASPLRSLSATFIIFRSPFRSLLHATGLISRVLEAFAGASDRGKRREAIREPDLGLSKSSSDRGFRCCVGFKSPLRSHMRRDRPAVLHARLLLRVKFLRNPSIQASSLYSPTTKYWRSDSTVFKHGRRTLFRISHSPTGLIGSPSQPSSIPLTCDRADLEGAGAVRRGERSREASGSDS